MTQINKGSMEDPHSLCTAAHLLTVAQLFNHPERDIGVTLTYGHVGDAPLSIPLFKFFRTDYF